MKPFWSLLAALCLPVLDLGAAAAQTRDDETRREIMERYKPAAAYIVHEAPGGMHDERGSGLVIDPTGHVITAAHLFFRRDEEDRYSYFDPELCSATVTASCTVVGLLGAPGRTLNFLVRILPDPDSVGRNGRRDFAVIRLPPGERPAAEHIPDICMSYRPERYETLYVLGFNDDAGLNEPMLAEARFISMDLANNLWAAESALVGRQFSGGAVLTGRGELIGIVKQGLVFQSLFHFVPMPPVVSELGLHTNASFINFRPPETLPPAFATDAPLLQPASFVSEPEAEAEARPAMAALADRVAILQDAVATGFCESVQECRFSIAGGEPLTFEQHAQSVQLEADIIFEQTADPRMLGLGVQAAYLTNDNAYIQSAGERLLDSQQAPLIRHAWTAHAAAAQAELIPAGSERDALYRSAILSMDALLGEDGSVVPWALSRRGLYHAQLGETEAAEDDLQAALRRLQSDPRYRIPVFGDAAQAYGALERERAAEKYGIVLDRLTTPATSDSSVWKLPTDREEYYWAHDDPMWRAGRDGFAPSDGPQP
jgi:hypothetical protein